MLLLGVLLPQLADGWTPTQLLLTPTLTKGLIALCRAKPDAPVEWLARWLLDNNPKMPKP